MARLVWIQVRLMQAILADPTVADIVFSSKYSATDANLSVSGLTNYPPRTGIV